jgi:hypothetical protein
MMVKGMPKIGSATTAPTPAEGRVDRIVTGWMKVSYDLVSNDRNRHQLLLGAQRFFMFERGARKAARRVLLGAIQRNK